MAVADVHYRFILVDIGTYIASIHSVLLKLSFCPFVGDAGRHSDGGIFSNSEFGPRLENKQMFIPSAQPLPGMCLCMFNLLGTTGPSLPFVMVRSSSPRQCQSTRRCACVNTTNGRIFTQYGSFPSSSGGRGPSIERLPHAALSW